MRYKSLLAAIGSIALLAATAAHADNRYFQFGQGAPQPKGITEVDQFGLDTLGHAPGSPGGSNWTWTTTGDVEVVNGSSSGQWAAPACSGTVPGCTDSGGADGANYLAITANNGIGSATLTFGDAVDRYLQVYIGSLDPYNSITFNFVTAPSITYTGGALGTLSGADNGSQTIAQTNGLFTFLFGNAIKSVVFSSTSNSFEIGGVFAAPTPEPETWALMILGVGMAGCALRFMRKPLEGPLVQA